MALVETDFQKPGDTMNATTDAALLTALEALTIERLNLRRGAIGAPHFDCDRSATLSAVELATATWVGTHAPAGTATISDTTPTQLSPGGTDLELNPPNAVRATMKTGDVLRWHFSCNVDTTTETGLSDEDYFWFEFQMTGVDDNGTDTQRVTDNKELGMIAGYSMNSSRVASASVGAACNQEISDQRVSVSGYYIHQGQFTTDGGDMRPTNLQVLAYCENAGTTFVVSNARLTAMILKG